MITEPSSNQMTIYQIQLILRQRSSAGEYVRTQLRGHDLI